MTLNTKKYLITTEKHEVCIVKSGYQTQMYFCEKCGFSSEFISLDAATTQSGVRTGELFKLVEFEKLHSIETATGHLLICKSSLEKILE
jgi:hypothetical protein